MNLSLVIATYNRATELIAALETVAMQDFPMDRWECVVVNNNSTDDTEARFAEFAKQHPELNIRMVFEERQGLSHARNRGIAESHGEIIAIIDDDERICKGFVGAYMDFFDTHPKAMTAGGRIVAEYPEGRPEWMSRYTERAVANPIDLGPKIRIFPCGRIPGGGNMALRREVFDKFGAFDPALGRSGETLIGGEESELFERLKRAGVRPWYVPGAVMTHVIPARKTAREYFANLSYNIGVSQRLRATSKVMLYAKEAVKWMATLLLVLILKPVQARYLILMRRQISRGIFISALH